MSEGRAQSANRCVVTQRAVVAANKLSCNPQQVMKIYSDGQQTGNDAFSHKVMFLVSVCNLLSVIGSQQWRAEVFGRTWSTGGGGGTACCREAKWLDRCMTEVKAHAAKQCMKETRRARRKREEWWCSCRSLLFSQVLIKNGTSFRGNYHHNDNFDTTVIIDEN